MIFRLPTFEFWITLMNWILFFLIILIVFLYSFRRFKRWGKSIASNIEYNEKTIKLTKKKFEIETLELKMRLNQEKDINIEIMNNKTILVFTPFFFAPSRFTFFLTGLAELGYNIISLKTRSVIKSLSNNPEKWYDLLNIISPDIIIFFDVSANLFLNTNTYNNIQSKKDSKLIKLIIIRPLFCKEHMNLFRFIPFTYRWFYLVFVSLFGVRSYIKKSITNMSKNSISSDKQNLFLIPRYNLQNKEELAELRNYNIVKVIEGGGFSFYKYETIVVGHISAFLNKISK